MVLTVERGVGERESKSPKTAPKNDPCFLFSNFWGGVGVGDAGKLYLLIAGQGGGWRKPGVGSLR